jgi:hypothetical protein
MLDDIYTRIARMEDQIRRMHQTPSYVERINPVTLPNPVEGQIAIDARTNCLIYYANEAWREKCSAVHACKAYGDRTLNKVRDGAFRFPVEEDLADTLIEQVQAFNGTEGVGATSIQIRNITRSINILDTIVSVPSGLFISAGQADINDGGDPDDPNNMVHDGDMLWINFTAVGTGSKGGGAYITFHGPKVNLEKP